MGRVVLSVVTASEGPVLLQSNWILVVPVLTGAATIMTVRDDGPFQTYPTLVVATHSHKIWP